MTEGEMSEELLAFFKALADANRLKIVGLLAQQPYSVEQLAAILHLRPSTISHHLSKLSEVGLVSARPDSYYNVYKLEEETLRKTRLIFSQQDLAAVVENVDLDAYDRKVVEDYSLPDGRLKIIPAQRKKLEIVLRYVVQVFEPGARYSENQVNEMLARFHEDTATLRRELIGYGLMGREGGGGEYWRV
jgi:DNA-binding MarR family transcriptional regulator